MFIVQKTPCTISLRLPEKVEILSYFQATKTAHSIMNKKDYNRKIDYMINERIQQGIYKYNILNE